MMQKKINEKNNELRALFLFVININLIIDNDNNNNHKCRANFLGHVSLTTATQIHIFMRIIADHHLKINVIVLHKFFTLTIYAFDNHNSRLADCDELEENENITSSCFIIERNQSIAFVSKCARKCVSQKKTLSLRGGRWWWSFSQWIFCSFEIHQRTSFLWMHQKFWRYIFKNFEFWELILTETSLWILS